MADLEIYEIDSAYIEYLSAFEEHLFRNKRVTQDFSRKYIGIILEIEGFKYFVPISSLEGTGFDVVKSSTTEKTTEKDKNSTEKTAEKILLLMKENSKVTTAQLADKTGLSVDGINYNIKKLKKANQIFRIGGDKGGFWKVL